MIELIEKWEWIINHAGEYEVSTFGNVRSYKGLGRNPKPQKIPKLIKVCKDGRGYLNFTVRENNKPKVLLIHVEEAKVFLPNPDNLKLVRHLNDIKSDNRLSNLAWGTYKDNRADGIINNKHFHKEGERAVKAKLTYREVYKIFNSTENNCQLGRKYDVTESTISKIKLGRGWNHVTGIPRIK